MMIKPYEKQGGLVRYWEAWDADDGTALVHWGNVGRTGARKRVRIPRGKAAKAVIKEEMEQLLSDGFRTLPVENLKRLIVQYRTEGWGSLADLDKRNMVEHILCNQSLPCQGSGRCGLEQAEVAPRGDHSGRPKRRLRSALAGPF